MDELRTLWASMVAPYWLQVAWALSAPAWALLTFLWGVQTVMAAQATRWPAMYIHAFKAFSAWAVTMFFVLSLLWREPAAVVTRGAFSRNIVGGMIVLALFLEACWRIKETVKTRGRQGI